MATCPKCQLPNPEAVESCIWCGGHRFAPEVLAGTEIVPIAAHPESLADPARTMAPRLPSAYGESIHTPNTPAPEFRPLPSHVGLLFTPHPVGGPKSSEARTLATTPAALAHQQAAIQQAAIITPAPSETAVQRLQAKLVVIRGQRINREYPIYEGRNVLGRFADRPVDIDLVAQEAEGQIWSSRQHAAITLDKNGLVVEDLNSLNGTWVNGARLAAGQKRPLRPNDVIQIGTVHLRLVIL